MKRGVAIAALVAAGLAVASCATPTPYQPATGTGQYRTGYWDERIDTDHFRVTFAGNSLTSRETVERYLLYRSAELAVQNGYDYFILVDRDTETKTNTYTDRGFGDGPFGYWHPYWRWYAPRWGWRSYDPFFDDPFWRGSDWDVRTVQRFEASANIAVGKGAKPGDNLRAFDAHEVLTRLGPNIAMPAAH
ncbi:hypothetical protein [Sphingomonas sp.]|uniref:CC0125/CC1285 family lipoprotein n=1 Tax=Sphingomonas sp. TaxID=28214 RepID=UPI001B04FFF4|nr:hypothetical protein [Sphingomonas sp.]MBO9712857.1 hypothetical protein [Sphingomonas sp.]